MVVLQRTESGIDGMQVVPWRSLAVQPAQLPATSKFDHEFIEMLDAYRATGGLLRSANLLCHLEQGNRDALLRLACKFVGGELLSFRWGGSVWLPMFQIQATTFEPRDEVSIVLKELFDIWDGWEIARWFVGSNQWLGGASPLSLLYLQPNDVRDAARAERFVCKG